MQSTEDTLFTIACDLGYPDGFALSNQMHRLVGIRPTSARDCLGWEWLIESWLRREAEEGGLLPHLFDGEMIRIRTRSRAPRRREGADLRD
jgi:hypothetical protein